MSDIVNKLWGFCNTLRHDGIDYGDYIEQLTYLLFIKMMDEKGNTMPDKTDWKSIISKSGTELIDHYADVLRILGRQSGILGGIYSGAKSAFTNPVNLRKLVSQIDETEWTMLDVDVKAAAFEGLLEKAASEGKKGAGQYFTPRILIQSIVRCIKPDPRKSRDFKIGDPACGSGGFLVCSYEWLKDITKGSFDDDVIDRIQKNTYFGQDLVDRPKRLALMNMYLHNIEPRITKGDTIYELPSDTRFDVILTNPPFGTKGANQSPERDDFMISTSNKQLNFIQHVMSVLKNNGRAAVVVPDNCLFADQAGQVFEFLTKDCNLHTVLRLPNGTFTPYSPGTKTNVIFFVKGQPTKTTWIYDARTNIPGITKKDRPLTKEYFEEFEKCYGNDPFGKSDRAESDSNQDRWRSFAINEIRAKEYKIDGLKWLKDELGEDDIEAEPLELAHNATLELTQAIQGLNKIIACLEENGNGQ